MHLKKNNLNKQKGITLIALVITVIIMLILVTVTVQVATDGVLFKHAGNAVKTTKNAVLYEDFILNGGLKIGGVAYNSIDEYISSQQNNSPTAGGPVDPQNPSEIFITAKNASQNIVGTYTSITEAAAAAGTNGYVILPEGIVEFDEPQLVNVSGLTLMGAGRDSTTIKTSNSYDVPGEGESSAFLTVAGDSVTIKDFSVDVSSCKSLIQLPDYYALYGFDCFRGVEVSTGEGVVIENISISGYYMQLLRIGCSETSSAPSVVASDLYVNADVKGYDSGYYWFCLLDPEDSDVELQEGTLLLNSGRIEGTMYVNSSATLDDRTTAHLKFGNGTSTQYVGSYAGSYVYLGENSVYTTLTYFCSFWSNLRWGVAGLFGPTSVLLGRMDDEENIYDLRSFLRRGLSTGSGGLRDLVDAAIASGDSGIISTIYDMVYSAVYDVEIKERCNL